MAASARPRARSSVGESAQQHQLLVGARIGGRPFVGLRVVANVAEEAVEDVVMAELWLGGWRWDCSSGHGLTPAASMNVAVQQRTASSSASRSIIQVMRNDEVAMPCGDDAGRGQRVRSAADVLERRVDAGADDADRAEVVGDAHRGAKARGERRAHARFLVQVLARHHQRQPAVRRRAAACRRRVLRIEKRRAASTAAVAQSALASTQHVAFAGDADDGARRCAADAPDDRAVGRRIGARQRRAVARA